MFAAILKVKMAFVCVPKIKENNMSTRGFCITKARRAERRKQADARNEEYNKKSLQSKLEGLPIGGAKKQRARLEVAVAKQQIKQVPASKEAVTQNNPNKKQENQKEGR
jgi:hypothetical protein